MVRKDISVFNLKDNVKSITKLNSPNIDILGGLLSTFRINLKFDHQKSSRFLNRQNETEILIQKQKALMQL